MRRYWNRQDLQGATLWWVVSLTVGGRVYRWAESPLQIDSDEAGPLSIAGGLQGAAVSQTAPWMGRAPEQRHAALELAPSAAGMDPSTLLSRRYLLDQAPVEVAIWKQGDAWEERQVRLQGLVVGYQRGGPSERLTLQATESAAQDRGILPETGALVSSTTWPNAAPSALGHYYPVVLGAPGAGRVPASMAILVAYTDAGGTDDWLLVAGHPVSATEVVVYDGTHVESLPVFSTTDGAGRVVTVVNLASTTITIDPALTYQCSWEGCGALAISGTAPASGAGSILETVLSKSTLPIDRGALASARDPLNAYKLGAFLTEQVNPFDWMVQAVLPFLPIAVLTGPDGWRVVPISLTPTRADCQCTLYAGDGAVRLERVTQEGFEDVSNEILLKYALDIQNNVTSATATISGAGYDGVAHTDLSSRLSRQTYGRRVRSTETIVVYDDSTAYRVVRWQAVAYAFTREVVRYSLSQEYLYLRPGFLWLEDTILGISAPAWVQRLDLTSDGGVEVELVLWQVPTG